MSEQNTDDKQPTSIDDIVNSIGATTKADDSSSSEDGQEVKEQVEDTKSSEDTDLVKNGKDDKVTDDEIPKEFHKNPRWQKLLRERNEARMALEGKNQASGLSEEDRKLIEEVKSITSSPTYIRSKMESEGYKSEKIDEVLKHSGHKVQDKPEDLIQVVASGLNLDLDRATPEQKSYINDIVSVANVLLDHKLATKLPEQLRPLSEQTEAITREVTANKTVKEFREVVKDEGILDYEKDVEPALQKFMDDNPKATLNDVRQAFYKITRNMTVERLKSKDRKDVRDDKKSKLQPALNGVNVPQGNLPKRSGNFSKDVDSILESVGL